MLKQFPVWIKIVKMGEDKIIHTINFVADVSVMFSV